MVAGGAGTAGLFMGWTLFLSANQSNKVIRECRECLTGGQTQN